MRTNVFLPYLSESLPKIGRNRSLEIEKAEKIRPIKMPPAPILFAITGRIGEIIPIPTVSVNNVRDAVNRKFLSFMCLIFTEFRVINKVYIRFPSK